MWRYVPDDIYPCIRMVWISIGTDFRPPKCGDIDRFGIGWVPIRALYHHRIAMQNTYGGNLRKYYALGAYSLIYTIYRYIRYILVI